ncbi:MAG: hypothetical protein VYD19_11720 [Myxococcota bacterium]|nr:hypothetical protein [Myxococcota bacterium]
MPGLSPQIRKRCAAAICLVLSCWGQLHAVESPASEESLQLRQQLDAELPPFPVCVGQRLTIIFPALLRSAVPARSGMLQIHLRGAVAVIEARPRLSRGEEVAVNFLIDARAPKSIRFQPQRRCQLALVELTDPPVERERRYLLEEVSAATLSQPSADSEGDPMLREVLDTGYQRRLLDALASGALTEQLDETIRTRAGLIYLSVERQLSWRDGSLIVLQLRNHSQPTFSLERLRVRCPGVATQRAPWVSERPHLEADGRPLRVALRAPCQREAGPIEIELCGDAARCLQVELP